jgi:hypothetical protein
MSQETLEKTEEEQAAEATAAKAAARADAPESLITESDPEADNQFLGMSDEDFEKLDSPSSIVPVDDEPPKAEDPPAEEPKAEEPPVDPAPKAEEPVKEDPPAEPVQDPVPAVEPAKAEDAPKEEPKPEVTVDKAAVYDKLFAPFKANGKEVQVRNADEALRLMQMGAGHMRYQQQTRPAVALKATLDANGIDADTLNYLIELKNGNKDAIAKLVRESGIEPYDIKTDDEAKQADKDYRPKDYSVSDESVTFAETVQSVRSSDLGNELLAHVRSDAWDVKSRQMLQGDPGILSALNDQKQNGVYDQISAEVERQRTLGGLTGMSFLEAYHQVGVEMDKNGAFKQPEPVNEGGALKETGQQPAPSQVIEKKAAEPKPAAGGDPSGVAPVKPGAPVKAPTEDIMNMSDEEFEKRFA